MFTVYSKRGSKEQPLTRGSQGQSQQRTATSKLRSTLAVRLEISGCDKMTKNTLNRYRATWIVRFSADGHDQRSPVAVRSAQFIRAVRSRVNGCDSMGTVVVRSAQSRRDVGSKSNGCSRKGTRPGFSNVIQPVPLDLIRKVQIGLGLGRSEGYHQ